jgi:DNA-binding transcriptional MerR regulator
MVRNLERDGVLPLVPRSRSGYRQYGDRHLHTVLAYRALSTALGPVQGKALLRAVDPVKPEKTVAALDEAHALLHRERSELRAAREAARLIAAEPVDGNGGADSMSVSELAEALGVRPSALRHWEAEGLVVPDRWSSRRIRRYSPAHVRDARIVYQLRTAGHRIDALKTLIPALRAGHQQQSLDGALDARQATLTKRSLALLQAARSVHVILAAQ